MFSLFVLREEYETNTNLVRGIIFCETIAPHMGNAREFLKTLCKVVSEVKMSVLSFASMWTTVEVYRLSLRKSIK